MNAEKKKRTRGRRIAAVILLVLLAGGGWAVYRHLQIPAELLGFAAAYPEARSFVMQYPKEAGRHHEIALETTEGIPLLLQWDTRWGYERYGDSWIGDSGCGPTCLSMVVVGLTGQTQQHPLAVARLSEANGWYVEGVGTAWDLMTEGAAKLGVQGERGELTEEWILAHLSAQTPMIASMKPGDFTYGGHFIVLTGIEEDGRIRVNDPNSPERSGRSWDVGTLVRQMKGLWVYRLPEDETA